MTVRLASNPSHLEVRQPGRRGRDPRDPDRPQGSRGRPRPERALAVLIHGDAAFPGQGVVAETLNLENLPGYSTGGTLHLIANNQIGFTTDPAEARSTRYSSDIAKGFDIPIVHVNADDAEAAVSAIRLAMAYRERFRKDFVVDLVGYRRFGHNEGDEPAYTQPLMYKTIESHPSLREQYARGSSRRAGSSRTSRRGARRARARRHARGARAPEGVDRGGGAGAEGEGRLGRGRRPDRDRR